MRVLCVCAYVPGSVGGGDKVHLVRRCVQQGMLGINSVCYFARTYRFAPARRCDQLPRLVLRRLLPAELMLQLQTHGGWRKSSAEEPRDSNRCSVSRECARMRKFTNGRVRRCVITAWVARTDELYSNKSGEAIA
jgi:hypothetical protein